MPTVNTHEKVIHEGEVVFNPAEVVSLLRDAGISVPTVDDEQQYSFYVTCPHNGLQIDVQALGGLRVWWKEKGQVAPSAIVVSQEDSEPVAGASK